MLTLTRVQAARVAAGNPEILKRFDVIGEKIPLDDMGSFLFRRPAGERREYSLMTKTEERRAFFLARAMGREPRTPN